jgi:hypothetical protein
MISRLVNEQAEQAELAGSLTQLSRGSQLARLARIGWRMAFGSLGLMGSVPNRKFV